MPDETCNLIYKGCCFLWEVFKIFQHLPEYVFFRRLRDGFFCTERAFRMFKTLINSISCANNVSSRQQITFQLPLVFLQNEFHQNYTWKYHLKYQITLYRFSRAVPFFFFLWIWSDNKISRVGNFSKN